MAAPRDRDDRRVAEEARERLGLEGRRHHRDAQIGPDLSTHPLHSASERSASRLRSWNSSNTTRPTSSRKDRPGACAPGSPRDDQQPSARAGALLEADLEADLVARHAAPFERDAARRRARGEATRFEQDDAPPAGEAGVEQGRRHARRLSAPVSLKARERRATEQVDDFRQS